MITLCTFCKLHTVFTVHTVHIMRTIHTVHTMRTVHTVHTVHTGLTLHTVHTVHTFYTVHTLPNVHTVQTEHTFHTVHTGNTGNTLSTFYTVLIFTIDAKSEDFPGIRKVFCCGKIPIKTSKKSKKMPKKYSGNPVFLVQVGQLAPLYQSPGNHWSSNLVKTSIFMSKTPKNAWIFRFDGVILEKIAIKNSHLDQLCFWFFQLSRSGKFRWLRIQSNQWLLPSDHKKRLQLSFLRKSLVRVANFTGGFEGNVEAINHCSLQVFPVSDIKNGVAGSIYWF